MNVLLCAEDGAGIQVIRALAQRDHRIVAVMARPTPASHHGGTVWSVAGTLGFPTWPVDQVTHAGFADTVRAHDVDIILNVYSLFIINPRVLGAARLGGYNLHPGPLPRYAGLNSVSWAIYRGERSHGVTVHRMEPSVDTGTIAYQEVFPIERSDTALMVSARCVKIGVDLMMRLVDTMADDPRSVPASTQDLTLRTYYGREVPQQGRVRWTDPAATVIDFIRACDYHPLPSPWGHTQARLGGRSIGIAKAERTSDTVDAPAGTIGAVDGGAARVACGDEWVSVSRVHVDGRYQPAAEVLQEGGRFDA